MCLNIYELMVISVSFNTTTGTKKMIKNTLIALVVAAAASGAAAAPALASSSDVFSRIDTEQEHRFTLNQLQRNGVDATRVEEWNGYVRAFVQTDSGQVIRLFEPLTLKPVS